MRFSATIDVAQSVRAISYLMCVKQTFETASCLSPFVLFVRHSSFLSFSHFHNGCLPSFSAHSRWFFEISLAVFVADVANVEILAFFAARPSAFEAQSNSS